MHKRDARTLTPLQLDEVRSRAIGLFNQGYNRRKIAKLLEVHYNSVGRWIEAYEKEGPTSIISAKRGRKPGEFRRLTSSQEKAVQKMICDKTPDQLKMGFALWTRRAVCDLIEQQFEISLPIQTCGDYLRRWGFTPQCPATRYYEQNPEAVRRWVDEEYPDIAKQAAKEKAEIHWGDETGLRSDCQHGRGYAPKGETPVVKTSSRRFSVNMISTITNQGKVRWMIYKDSFNSDVFINFLKRLIKDTTKKVFLIVDNLRIHHSAPVKEWVEPNKEKISLFYLPSYSPERNPDEYLHCDLKASIKQKPSPRNKEELESNLKSHMAMLSKSPQRVASYFKNKHISYAAAA